MISSEVLETALRGEYERINADVARAQTLEQGADEYKDPLGFVQARGLVTSRLSQAMLIEKLTGAIEKASGVRLTIGRPNERTGTTQSTPIPPETTRREPR
jgi:hypothetical protein